MLQRGRTRGSAERAVPLEGRRRALPASTGPHSWECGEDAQRTRPRCAAWLGFNGAALVGVRRGRARPRTQRIARHASTGPHSWECGEVHGVVVLHVAVAALQRGRTRGSAESRLDSSNAARPRAASTGPHSWECGEVKVRKADATAEGLQRGRTRGSAERRSAGWLVAMISPASTGPHSWECGEGWNACASRPPAPSFNGAALVGVRRGSRTARPVRRPHRFNGAALVGVRRGRRARC